MNNIRIIQSSPPQTGSTFLLNIIHGFLCPYESIHWNTENLIDSFLITKTHETDLNKFIERYKNYDLYFVMSERNDEKIQKLIDKDYRNMKNVLIINYDEINETKTNTLDNIVNNMFDKFLNFFPKEIIPNKDNDSIKNGMRGRILFMNRIVEEIKDKPFSHSDGFTGIHGGHRNRTKT